MLATAAAYWRVRRSVQKPEKAWRERLISREADLTLVAVAARLAWGETRRRAVAGGASRGGASGGWLKLQRAPQPV